jgi:hypothetical protein
MSLVKEIFKMISGKAHFYLYVSGKPAVEIILHKREIIADIKNPILAIELGLHSLGKKGKLNSYLLRMIKAAGFKVKVKYKMLELEI